MTTKHVPSRGPEQWTYPRQWTYPKSEDVLEECGMYTIEEYIVKQRNTITAYHGVRTEARLGTLEVVVGAGEGLGCFLCNWIGR